MSTQRGIFEAFPNQTPPAGGPPAGSPPASPFVVAAESPRGGAVPSPFTPAAVQPKTDSPFSVVDEEDAQDDPKTVRLPDRRKPAETPFQISEPQGFGFEAPPQALKATQYDPTKQTPAPQAAAPSSPFTVEHAPAAPAHAPSAPANPFGGWPQAEASPPAPQPQPAALVTQPPAPAPAPQPTPTSGDSSNSDSYSIKQLELRAIFGVDREMTKEEIIQRSRSLPGIRQIARVSESDIAAVDALKTVISNLGFGGGSLKLYSGSVPIEFIREGSTLLAVQTDGGFAPGVRETLMIVARELSK